MKPFTKALLSSILLILILSHGLYGQTYYYGFNEKIHIDQQANKYIAEFDTIISEIDLQRLTTCSRIKGDTYIIADTSQIGSLGVSYSISKTYKTENGFELMGSNKILIKYHCCPLKTS